MKTNLTYKIGIIACLLFLTAQFQVHAQGNITLEKISTYYTDVFAESATEIVAHDPLSQRLYVTNGNTGAIDILDISDPANIVLHASIDLSPYGKSANSVDVHEGIVAAAVENVNKQADGKIVFFDRDGNFINQVTAGALPDNVVFAPNGRYVLSANEGEPNDDFTVDPEGSVTIVNLRRGVYNITQADVSQVGFTIFNNATLDPSVRVSSNPGFSTVAQDIEPEYITVSKNSRYAWVALQENNAIAIIDIRRAKILSLKGLGFKDHSQYGNGLDASNETADIDIANWPIKGMYMPDAMTSYKKWGREYIVLANEGDSRDYAGYSEETRVKDLALDPVAFPNAAALQSEDAIGRMKTTIATGDADGDGLFEEIYTYGARSFSIRRASGSLIYDSGDDFEQITAAQIPNDFNSTNDENFSFKDRSDDKGPEPEAVEVAKYKGRTYAFIGLERVGGIMIYDISNPYHPSFIEYINNRNFNVPANTRAAEDLGPEDLVFVKKRNSPVNSPLLISANEVSGTITIFKVKRDYSSAYQSDARTLEVEEETPEEELTLATEQLQVYPNPVESGLLSLNQPVDAVIFNIHGRKVMTVQAVRKVDVSSLKKGLYVLRTNTLGAVKFIIK
ncbi:MAG: choice-of-anchor I family protein [Reichenbachiella sp.]|uniref:choice-of-anchor I family protein n=1 Tax=Reichenbachiella sp. TaxID=2184521 RepID=UPI003266E325